MANWEKAAQQIDGKTGRTEPRERIITRHAPKTKAFSISVSQPVAADLDDIAAVKGMSRNAVINEALELYIDRFYENQKG